MVFSERILSSVLVLIATAIPLTAQEELDASASPAVIDLTSGVTFEVSPHTGIMGSSGIFGLRASMNYSSLNLELAGEQVIGKMANMYPVSVNLVLNLATRGRLIPYGAVGTGLLLTVPTNSIGNETVTSLSLNFGGGARYYITPTFGIRAEVKQYLTTVESKRDLRDELLIFQEFSIGATFMFR